MVNVKYYNRRGKEMDQTIEKMKALSDTICETTEIDELMGLEGNIRILYYDAFNLIINDFERGLW